MSDAYPSYTGNKHIQPAREWKEEEGGRHEKAISGDLGKECVAGIFLHKTTQHPSDTSQCIPWAISPYFYDYLGII